MSIGSQLVNLHQHKLDKCIFVGTKGSLPEILNDYNKFYNFTPSQLNSVDSIYDFFTSSKTVAVTRYEWLKHFNQDLMNSYTKDLRLGMWWDEAQKLKNGSKDEHQSSGTQAHKYAKFLRNYCSSFHAVTATPIMTSLDDLWGIMHIVDNTVFGDYKTFCNAFYEQVLVPHPKERYRKTRCPVCRCELIYKDGWDYCTNPACRAIQSPYGYLPYKVKVRSVWDLVEYKNIETLATLLQSHMFSFFPPQDINYIIHKFDLSDDAFSKYVAIAKNLDNEDDFVPFTTRRIELQYAVDRSLEKRQELWRLANKIKHKGFVLYLSLYNTPGTNTMSSTTLQEVKEVLDNVEGLEYRAYSGQEKEFEREENKKWFQNDPVNKCLIITEAGGASLNLQVTNEFVFYSMPDGFGKISQALGRIVRLFSTYKTFNIHVLMADKTIDLYKYIVFMMYSELIMKIMNNNLFGLKEPIKYNSIMKTLLRQKYCWKNGIKVDMYGNVTVSE